MLRLGWLCVISLCGVTEYRHAYAADPMHIVTFGTSLTERGGWQTSLKTELEKCLQRPVEIEIIARSGSTSDWAVENVERVVRARPDIVLVEFYANDAAITHYFTTGRSRSNMETVFDSLRSGLPEARVVNMVMNPIFWTRGWVRPFLGSYIAAHRLVADARGIETIDHTPSWSALSQEDLDVAIPDGLHPTPSAASEIMVPTLVHAIVPDCAR